MDNKDMFDIVDHTIGDKVRIGDLNRGIQDCNSRILENNKLIEAYKNMVDYLNNLPFKENDWVSHPEHGIGFISGYTSRGCLVGKFKKNTNFMRKLVKPEDLKPVKLGEELYGK